MGPFVIRQADDSLLPSDYVAQMIGSLERPARLEKARQQGRKTVALLGAAMPEEIFWACGAMPILLSRTLAAMPADPPLPRDACPLAQTAVRLLRNHWLPAGLLDAVVAVSACDWTARIGEICRAWPVNIARASAMSKHASSRQILGSLEAMLGQLELLTDQPLTRRAWAAAREHQSSLAALCRRLDQLRAVSPPPLSASDYYQLLGALDFADPDQWMADVQTRISKLQSEAEPAPSKIQNSKSKTVSPRILLAGCPWGFPDSSLIEQIEQAGFQIVGEAWGAHARRAGEPEQLPNSRREVLQWIAMQLATASARPSVSDLIACMAERGASGIVRIHYYGCAVEAMKHLSAQPELAARGVRTLVLEIERLPVAAEVWRTRLEAFREQLDRESVEGRNIA